MHFGIVAAGAPQARTLDVLNGLFPGLVATGQHGSRDDLPLDTLDDGWQMAFGERDGRTYVLDISMLLSSDPDATVAGSQTLSGTVVGCGAETTSGTFWFYAARNGALLRGYWRCYTDMTAPWSRGQPLASEAEQAFEDLDGAGLTAGLAALGFDYESWASGSDLQGLSFAPRSAPPSFPRPLAQELELFRQTVAIPEDRQPKPRAVKRGGGYDLTVVPVAAVAAAPGKKGGRFGFLRRG